MQKQFTVLNTDKQTTWFFTFCHSLCLWMIVSKEIYILKMLQNPVKWNSSIKNLEKKWIKGIRYKDQNFERKNMIDHKIILSLQ